MENGERGLTASRSENARGEAWGFAGDGPRAEQVRAGEVGAPRGGGGGGRRGGQPRRATEKVAEEGCRKRWSGPRSQGRLEDEIDRAGPVGLRRRAARGGGGARRGCGRIPHRTLSGQRGAAAAVDGSTRMRRRGMEAAPSMDGRGGKRR